MNDKATGTANMRSMTGFAPIEISVDQWRITGDIRSVNGRGLDLRIRVPDWIEGLEPELRKALQAALGRGSVTLSMRVTRDETAATFRLNEDALNAAVEMLAHIESVAEKKGARLAAATPVDVAQMKGVVETSEAGADDTKALKAGILAEVTKCIADFDADRAREGASLANILTGQIEDVERLVGEARNALGDRAVAAKEAMQRGLARVLENTDTVDEARVAQELAVLAVKSDVAEELDRLDAHVEAARGLLGASGPVGRKLDFLMQEFNREANTLCSKAQSTALTTIGLNLKTVIDQMREQVQNVE